MGAKKKKQYSGIVIKKLKGQANPLYEVYGSLCNRVNPIEPLGIINQYEGRFVFVSGPSVMMDTLTLRELSRCVGDLQSERLDQIGKELRRQVMSGKLKVK